VGDCLVVVLYVDFVCFVGGYFMVMMCSEIVIEGGELVCIVMFIIVV